MKVPEVRFEGYEGEWERKSLSDKDFEIIAGGDIDNNLIKSNGEYPVIANALRNEGIVGYYNNHYRVKAPAVTVTGRGDIGIAKARTVNFTPIVRLLSIRSKHNIYFLENAINNHKVLVESTGVPQLTVPQLSKYEVQFPKTINEENDIGTLFQQLDNQISHHRTKLQKLQHIKQAMLTKMFPQDGAKVPEVRFEGFEGDWEEKKLGDVATKVNEKNTELKYSTTLTNSAEYGIINQLDYFDHDVSNIDNINGYYIVRNDDFVYNPRISTFAPVGPVNRNKLNMTGVMSPLYTVFRTQNINNSYLEFFFKSNHWHPFMQFNGDTGARADRFAIKIDLFFEMPIPYPTLEEQSQIGSFFQQLDTLLAQHQKQLDKLGQIKSALLDKMFV